MRTVLSILLIGLSIAVMGQKLDGVYVGKLITEGNALVLTSKGESVNGNVYLTTYEKFTFLGNLRGDSLKGVILVPGGQEVVVLGKWLGDSLLLALHTDGGIRPTALSRISSKPNYDLQKFFGKQEPDRDSLLIGKWHLVRNINGEGKDITKESYFYEFLADGTKNYDVEHLKSVLEASYRKAGGRGALPFDFRMLPRSSWRTIGSKLNITSTSNAPGGGNLTFDYLIRYDTLTIINFKGGKEIMVRESKKK